ncbi:ABC transporter permease [Chitinophaga rhizophila]|uniref:ABC transporter permease n=1 Tax=Chitinophaga rhizophila TaxID=2866212 RepID=A0ABS7GAJ9_9BACT|nr:ABC transporter permease [Chitinophaga rhizophila]MBW8683563.1 ABC transporter permease [Chitinophaga rhizophila]
MLKNYFRIAFRNIWRSKGYTFINVTGLSIGFCICIFIFLIVYRQLTYDGFHKDGDRIFQTYLFANEPEKAERNTGMPLPLVPAVKAEYPEVEAAARVVSGKNLVEYKGKYFDKLITLTDPDFLQVFSFPLLKGNRATVLNEMSSMVISRDMAETVFGEEDPIGKQIQVGSEENKKTYQVTGVLEDCLDNSSVQYDALARIENLAAYPTAKDKWDAYMLTSFVKLGAGVDASALETRLKPFAVKYFPGEQERLKKKGARRDERGDLFALRLIQLEKVHFDTSLSGGKGAPIALVFALLGIALFILLIACINFINLSIARSFTRAKEVGIRKSLGALRSQLFLQIWGEATVICLTGVIAGAILAYLLMPSFNGMFQARLHPGALLQPGVLGMIGAVFVLVTLIAGGYPALRMARFNTVEVLKGKVSMKRPGVLRNSMIVGQFAMSALLICCTVIAVQQVSYLRQRPVGFNKEEVISIPVGRHVNGRMALERMRNVLLRDPDVLSVTGTGVNLGQGKDRISSRSILGFTYKDREVSSDWLLIDYDYLKTLDIKLLAGREFDPAYPGDSVRRVIITESMARMLGEKDPVGKVFQPEQHEPGFEIIGLIPDFNLYSAAGSAKPITMHISHSEPIAYIFVRVAPDHLTGAMDKLERVWTAVAPQSPFLGSFLDENVDAWYRDEQSFSQIFSIASGIAILLSCMGLFAIAIMIIEQRTKEIGIRKLLGASVMNILLIITREFVKMVLIALFIAIPIAWFAMQQWLDKYPYRIEINWMVFLIVGAITLLIALLTVSFQSVRAALMNPVKSLKAE